MKRFDERDILFARMNYTPGSPEYDDYYRRHPELKEVDSALRGMPPLGEPGSATYHPVHSPLVGSAFQFLSEIKHLSEGEPAKAKADIPGPEEMTRLLKGLAAYYGAKLTGICAMKDHHYYSHRGRETAHYGEAVTSSHPFGLVFAVEMEKDMILRAPGIPESLAAVKGYVGGAVIGMIISYYIRSLGYNARNHMDGNYLLIAPLAARDAGLGEIGRHGLLITKEFGPRVRLGVVTTDLPIRSDEPLEFGIQAFCTLCNRCAISCPGKAIPKGEEEFINGDLRWKTADTNCYQRWRMLGTDCGVCLASCPFSNELDPEMVDQMANSTDIMHQILREFNQKHKLRPMVREPGNWGLPCLY